MFYWKDRMEGRKEINNLNFHYFFFHLLYSFTERKYTAGRRVVDRCLEQVRKQRMCSGYLQLIHFVVFHLAEDSRLSWCFIEHDFSTGASFCGSTNILKINLGLPFRANSNFFLLLLLFFFIYVYREVYPKK